MATIYANEELIKVMERGYRPVHNIMMQGPRAVLHQACETCKFFVTRSKNATQRNARIDSESILALSCLHCDERQRDCDVTQHKPLVL